MADTTKVAPPKAEPAKPEPAKSLSPSETLAAEVVDRLIAAGLLRAKSRESVIAKVGVGAMKGEDWRLEIELAQGKDKCQ